MLFLVRARSCSRRFLLRGRRAFCLCLLWCFQDCDFSFRIRGCFPPAGLSVDGRAVVGVGVARHQAGIDEKILLL